MRVAFVHDWLVTWRGGEKVLAAMAELFPGAPIYTLFHDPDLRPEALSGHPIVTSPLDRVPLARQNHRYLLPALPGAVRRFDLAGVDLVISSSHCVAKGVRVPASARHLSYVHAPLRYMWDRFDDYFGPGRSTASVRLAARSLRPWLRAWDVWSARSVDRFVANSRHVSAQIAARYHRHAAVIHPPVELERFTAQAPSPGGGGYFLVVGAMAPYKRVDLAIAAARQLGVPLWIAGSGQASKQWLRDLPPHVRALGQVSDAELPALFRGARALVFPGQEDFGLTPLEAQACGRPVIAFAGGGALETVTPSTGVFFPEPTVASLVGAIQRFEVFEKTFSPEDARANAARFSKSAFQTSLRQEIQKAMEGAVRPPPSPPTGS